MIDTQLSAGELDVACRRDFIASLHVVLTPDDDVRRHVLISRDRTIVKSLPRSTNDMRHDGIDWWVITGWAYAAAHPDEFLADIIQELQSDSRHRPDARWLDSFRTGFLAWHNPDRDRCPVRAA